MLEPPAKGRGGLLFQPCMGFTKGPEEQWLNRAWKGGWALSALRGGEGSPSQRAACAKATWPSIGHVARAGNGKDHRTPPGMAAPPSWPLPVLEGLGLAYPGITREPEWPVQIDIAWPGATCCPLAKGQGGILLERAGLLCCPRKTSKCWAPREGGQPGQWLHTACSGHRPSPVPSARSCAGFPVSSEPRSSCP